MDEQRQKFIDKIIKIGFLPITELVYQKIIRGSCIIRNETISISLADYKMQWREYELYANDNNIKKLTELVILFTMLDNPVKVKRDFLEYEAYL